MIFNAYNQKILNRVEISDNPDVQISKTYLTDTYDLFIVTNLGSKYSVYKIDLDASNMNEVDTTKKQDYQAMINKQFSIGKPIFTYDEIDVNKRMLKEIMARGESEEDDQCLFIFMLHDDSIYCWK